MSNFGALTDHFGILATVDGAGTLATKLKLVGSSKTARALNRGDATDENGDIAATTFYGPPNTMFDASSEFEVVGGTVDLALIKLGEFTGTPNKIRASLSVTTDAGAWPRITVSGQLGTIAITAPSGKTNKFSLPSIDILAIKAAQNFGGDAADGFTVGAGAAAQSSSLEFSIDIAETNDGLGVPSAHAVSGGTSQLSATLRRVSAAPTATVDTDTWTITAAPGIEEGQADYHTGTLTAAGTIERDAA